MVHSLRFVPSWRPQVLNITPRCSWRRCKSTNALIKNSARTTRTNYVRLNCRKKIGVIFYLDAAEAEEDKNKCKAFVPRSGASSNKENQYHQSLEGMTFQPSIGIRPQDVSWRSRAFDPCRRSRRLYIDGNQRIVSIVLTFWGRSGRLGRSRKKIRQSPPWPAQIKKDNTNRWRRPKSWQLLKSPFTWNFSFRGWVHPTTISKDWGETSSRYISVTRWKIRKYREFPIASDYTWTFSSTKNNTQYTENCITLIFTGSWYSTVLYSSGYSLASRRSRPSGAGNDERRLYSQARYSSTRVWLVWSRLLFVPE